MPDLFFFFFFFLGVTGELSTLRQLMKVPNEPGLSPNNGLGNVSLSDQSMASHPPPKKQKKRVWTIHTAIWRLAYSSSLLLVQNAFAAAVTRHAIQTKGPDHSIPDRQWSKLLYSRLIQYSLAVIAQALMNLVYL